MEARVSSVRPIASRPGWVSVCVGGRRVGALTDEVAASLHIARGASWTPGLASAFENESRRLECLVEAHRLLRFADHTAASLAARLVLKGHGEEVVQRVVEELSRTGTLDDAQRAVRRAEIDARRGKGPRLIEARLRAAGHEAEEAARAAGEAAGGALGSERAERFVRARLAVRHISPQGLSPADLSRERRRLFALLVRNGFDEEIAQDAIERVLGRVQDD